MAQEMAWTPCTGVAAPMILLCFVSLCWRLVASLLATMLQPSSCRRSSCGARFTFVVKQECPAVANFQGRAQSVVAESKRSRCRLRGSERRERR